MWYSNLKKWLPHFYWTTDWGDWEIIFELGIKIKRKILLNRRKSLLNRTLNITTLKAVVSVQEKPYLWQIIQRTKPEISFFVGSWDSLQLKFVVPIKQGCFHMKELLLSRSIPEASLARNILTNKCFCYLLSEEILNIYVLLYIYYILFLVLFCWHL